MNLLTGGSDEPMDKLFHKGVAISVWQNSGGENSNWGAFEKGSKCCGLIPNIQDKSQIGNSNHFWEKYEEDIELAVRVGVNSFRFSFEWHRIEPEQGQIDQSAIDKYHKILDCLEKHNLVPNATIHHFVHPIWFEELGSFTNPDSIGMYVNYAQLLFEHFGKRVTFWSTFNEPTCAMFCGFMIGGHPPGKIFAMKAAGRFLMNMLISHCRAYHAIKKMEGGKNSRIGIVTHHVWFEPANKSWISAHVRYACHWMTYFWGKDVVKKFFMTDKFEWEIPVWGKVWEHVEAGARDSLDWMGINYYSRGIFNWFCLPRMMPGDVYTDMGYPMHGPGMYDSLVHWADLGVPMYVTETGCADKADAFRDKFINSYFDNIVRAIKDGYDVRGFYYWTLIDNFEWNCGYSMKFGLFKWEDDGQHLRTLREKSRVLIRLFTAWPSKLKDFVEAAKRLPEAELQLESNPAGLEKVTERQEEHGVMGKADAEPQYT